MQSSSLPAYTRDISAGHDALLGTEWLLTSGLGGYAMGTVLGVPTRRYHALLVAAVAPPVQREVMLSSLFETLIVAPGTPRQRTIELSSYRFRNGYEHPLGWRHLVRFTKSDDCRWEYRIAGVEITKTLRLHRDRAAASITYDIHPEPGAGLVRLQLRPLLAMRDAYGLLRAERGGGGGDNFGDVLIHGMHDHIQIRRWERTLNLTTTAGRFHADSQWWYDFEYEQEKLRGLDHIEDLYSPGYFIMQAGAAARSSITITAWLGEHPPGPEEAGVANRGRLVSLLKTTNAASSRENGEVSPAEIPGWVGEAISRLTIASDDFVVRRSAPGSSHARSAAAHTGSAGAPEAGATIIAGYPWFSDWGRDSMISLPGLLLCTGRYGEARAVLETFARHRRNGLIPNLFHDHSGAADYNTLDASLWFLHATCEYLRYSRDREGFMALLRPACFDIIDHYRRGTEYNIRMDVDGLIAAGDATTQLTWMDARRDGVVFTPRHGKAVEISALWHHGLLSIAEAVGDDDARRARDLRALAARAGDSFRASFWNSERDCCFDVLSPGRGGGGGEFVPVDQVRPNQIFAVSLRHSPLTPPQQRAVVRTVKERLLTPHGLRTLDPGDPAYRGRFEGNMFERDGAYHNGTVWPWLIGPYCEAVLRSGGFSGAARGEVLGALRPLARRLNGEAIGQLPEVFDGDDTPEQPQRPGGCMAQAWSVAEVLRILVMLSAAA